MLLAAMVLAQDVDPLKLPIGTPGEVKVYPGEIRDLAKSMPVDPDAIARAADGKPFVFLGESHATRDHQILHARIIEALAKRGRKVVVGMEMMTRPKQAALDAWGAGVSESTFVKDGDWKGQWGYDFGFYEPIFAACRKVGAPMVALNVPRDWVRAVGRGGLEALKPEWRQELPAEIDLTRADHHKVFDAMMGGHPAGGPSADRMYSAQVLWDVGMSDTAARYLAAHPHDASTVFVVMAGSGHVMYRQGINGRLASRGLGEGITVVMTESDKPITVARGIGDFVFCSWPIKK